MVHEQIISNFDQGGRQIKKMNIILIITSNAYAYTYKHNTYTCTVIRSCITLLLLMAAYSEGFAISTLSHADDVAMQAMR